MSAAGDDLAARLAADLDTAERKAWDSLAHYKFAMFGYWAGIWVHLNQIEGRARSNPFRDAVHLARARVPAAEIAPPPAEPARQVAATPAMVERFMDGHEGLVLIAYGPPWRGHWHKPVLGKRPVAAYRVRVGGDRRPIITANLDRDGQVISFSTLEPSL